MRECGVGIPCHVFHSWVCQESVVFAVDVRLWIKLHDNGVLCFVLLFLVFFAVCVVFFVMRYIDLRES